MTPLLVVAARLGLIELNQYRCWRCTSVMRNLAVINHIAIGQIQAELSGKEAGLRI